MSKFNRPTTKPAVHSPIVTDATPSGTTFEGAAGYSRSAQSELFLLAVGSFAEEGSFYESRSERSERYRELVHETAKTVPSWTARFLRWLRNEGNMRTAAIVGAAEFVRARLEQGTADTNESAGTGGRFVVDSVLKRADEPGEMIAYWTSRYGKAIPKPIKRGVADAVRRLYNERSLLKYDTASKGFRFGDVLELVHASPDPSKPWQSALFKHAIDRRHKREGRIPDALEMVRANDALRAYGETSAWLDSEVLANAGMTWEDALSAVGRLVDKAKLWEAMIPSMGIMALARNLRNFDEAGVRDEVAETVAKRFLDADEIAKSRMFPFRWLAAYNHASSLRWSYPLECALNHSLSNVPDLKGRTLILVDRSASMFGSVSEKSGLNFADSAALFGTAFALRNAGRADLVEYGTHSAVVPYAPGESVLKVMSRFRNLGGTYTAAAVQQHYRGHDRVIILTDEQAHHVGVAFRSIGTPGDVIPAHVPLYTVNLVGYQDAHAGDQPNRHWLGGLTDETFRWIPLLETGKNADWPF